MGRRGISHKGVQERLVNGDKRLKREGYFLSQYFQNKAISCAIERPSKIKADRSVGLLEVISVE